MHNRPCLVGRKKKFLYTNVGKILKKALAHVAACNALKSFSVESFEMKHQKKVYTSIFFPEQAFFDIRFSYKHCNFSRGCLPVKMTSKTVTSSITKLEIILSRAQGLVLYTTGEDSRTSTKRTRKQTDPCSFVLLFK